MQHTYGHFIAYVMYLIRRWNNNAPTLQGELGLRIARVMLPQLGQDVVYLITRESRRTVNNIPRRSQKSKWKIP